jgi:hypothetical protein
MLNKNHNNLIIEMIRWQIQKHYLNFSLNYQYGLYYF